MEMNLDLVQAIWTPSFVYRHRTLREQLLRDARPTEWDSSGLNPKNRIQALKPHSSLRWRIDGGMFGIRLFAVPLDLAHQVPLSIDVFLPNQRDMPRSLRDSLDIPGGIPLQAEAVRTTGLARHVCRAIEFHCNLDRHFLHRYPKLPFASKIVIQGISMLAENMEVQVVPNYELERKAASLQLLQSSWVEAIAPSGWPPKVNLMDLRLEKRLHDSVSLVRLPKELASSVDELAVFKFGTDDFEHILHEFKLLLQMKPHPNVMPRPLAVVTKKTNFGGKEAVLGFLLPYFVAGSLRDLLPSRLASGTLHTMHQLQWCKQVTSALIHVHTGPGEFYSDLRPDNVLISTPPGTQAGSESAILCDFEQRGNWYEWSPPEVLLRQYLENLRRGSQSHENSRYSWLLAQFPSDQAAETRHNHAWSSLTLEGKEKAMVYTLGLFFYCVFEGQSSVCGHRASRFTYEPKVNFPHFQRTPLSIQNIVKNCTKGGFSQIQNEALLNLCEPRGLGTNLGSKPVLRAGGLLYSKGNSPTKETSVEVLDTAFQWWENQLQVAGGCLSGGFEKLTYLAKDRPTLREVWHQLDVAQDLIVPQP